MPTTEMANAFPRKRFFMEMFTRDISLEDCILDLIDNSIDSLVRQKEIDPAADILKRVRRPKNKEPLPLISLKLSEKEISISDNCGGIPPSQVLTEVFSFGHDEGASLGQLGAYGIGLKRAIFKIGEDFEMRSLTAVGGFDAKMDVLLWAEKDDAMEDWKVPIHITGPERKGPFGTSIKFKTLRDEVKMRLRDGAFLGKLSSEIAKTYALFLEEIVRVEVNGSKVEPMLLPIASSDDAKPGQVEFTKGDVKVRIIATLAERKDQEWAYERAGWYVLCNGRIVLSADKSELTGWGEGLPRYHSKYNGFVGILVFRSRKPLALPWTTTKRGLNRESPVFQSAKVEMVMLARPIISFLNGMYPGELFESIPERRIAEKVKAADIRDLASKRPAPFELKKGKVEAKTTTKVQYEAELKDVERIRRAVQKPKWSANRIGRHTFEHFLKTECP